MKEIKKDLTKQLAKEQQENLKMLEEYAKIKHEKEILIKALKIIINHQE